MTGCVAEEIVGAVAGVVGLSTLLLLRRLQGPPTHLEPLISCPPCCGTGTCGSTTKSTEL